MDSILNHERNKKHYFIKAIIATNVFSILFGIVYLLMNTSNGMWNIYGIILLITLLGNLVITLIKSKHSALDYLYLVLTIIIMVTIPIMNKLVSDDITNTTSQSMITIILLFTLLGFGGLISILKLKNHSSSTAFSNVKNKRKLSKIKTVLITIILLILSISLIIGIYLAYELLIGQGAYIFEMVFPQHSLFFSIVILAISMLIIKIAYRWANKFLKFAVLITGVTFSVIFSLPLVTTIIAIQDAELSYIEAFGTDPKSIIPVEEQQYFSRIPFSLPDYFFGTPSSEYRIIPDILYYEGENEADEGIKLHFDAYLPPENGENLPGDHSVLIRVHGGGWTTGDKGSLNNAQVNKHFASQGYVVFDVQYGLSDREKIFTFIETPENIVSDFSINDMVRHIGIFTDYLADRHKDFGANIDSVFISGNSAGGQIANAVALGFASGQYDVINSDLTIKGIIPVYPANGLASIFGIEGSSALLDPSLLVTEDSPPALICQGTHDDLVDQAISLKFHQMYGEKGNSNAAVVLLPYAGHASVSYFPGYYNQLFIYFMERFMYQFK